MVAAISTLNIRNVMFSSRPMSTSHAVENEKLMIIQVHFNPLEWRNFFPVTLVEEQSKRKNNKTKSTKRKSC